MPVHMAVLMAVLMAVFMTVLMAVLVAKHGDTRVALRDKFSNVSVSLSNT